jgi:nanoRNase/pAp phosphatase (c-di-AMP/oligoRNAs hydrolase)
MEFLAGSEKRFFDFISTLNEKDKIALLCHNDGDGIVSAVIASKVLGKIDYVNIVNYQPGMLAQLAKWLEIKKINKIIAVDLALFEDKESIKMFEKFAQVLIIDHHPFKEDLNSDKTIFLKAATEFPASYMCYYLFSRIQEIPEWLAILGILSDTTPFRYNKENAEKIYEDFNIPGEKHDLYDLSVTVNLALIYFKDKEKKVYDIVQNAKLPKELKVLERYSSVINKEVEKYQKDFESNHEDFKGLTFYFYKPKYSINSMLSTLISTKQQDKVFVFVADMDNELHISARRQDGRLDCGMLLKEAVKDIPDSTAGGHVPAAGARVPSIYLDKFKENLIRTYSKMRHI